MGVHSINFSNGTLSYVGQDAWKIPEVLPKMFGAQVVALDLSYNSLTTLKNLDGFPNLQMIILDNNQLTEDIQFPRMPTVHTLSLNKNMIADLDSVLNQIENAFPNLRYLSLLGNGACPNQLSHVENSEDDYQRYRYYTLFRLPSLIFLDSSPITIDERKISQERGQYMKVARPSAKLLSVIESPPKNLNYTPLPEFGRSPSKHEGNYGKLRYKYIGKNSEGNRFIMNHHL